MHLKLVPDPFLNSFKMKVFWKKIIKKTFFFLAQSHLMDKIITNKRGLELVTSHSSSLKILRTKSSFRWNKKHFSQFLKSYHLVK